MFFMFVNTSKLSGSMLLSVCSVGVIFWLGWYIVRDVKATKVTTYMGLMIRTHGLRNEIDSNSFFGVPILFPITADINWHNARSLIMSRKCILCVLIRMSTYNMLLF